MIRKTPHCRKCNTPMKGHSRGKCRSLASNNVVVAVKDEKNIVVQVSQIYRAPPPGACAEREAWLAFCRADSDEESEDEMEMETLSNTETEVEVVDEWKPMANKTWWEYYRNWQGNSLTVPFPTSMGMTSKQLGDIMQNYSKYVAFYQ